MHHDRILIDIHQLCALNFTSVQTLLFIPESFDVLRAPSSGTFKKKSVECKSKRCRWRRKNAETPKVNVKVKFSRYRPQQAFGDPVG
jgi:hypothetical protein